MSNKNGSRSPSVIVTGKRKIHGKDYVILKKSDMVDEPAISEKKRRFIEENQSCLLKLIRKYCICSRSTFGFIRIFIVISCWFVFIVAFLYFAVKFL